MIPAGVELFGVWTGARITQRYEDRHAISATIIRSDSAAPREEYVGDPFTDALVGPPPTPTPDPDPEYTYTVLVRNSGDFPEENVIIDMSVEVESPSSAVSAQFDASSRLLGDTIEVIAQKGNMLGITMTLQRLNPNEWVSYKATWKQPVEVDVEVRSDHASDSDNT